MSINEMKKLICFSGAGISADSGVPTFRGSGKASTWANYDVDIVSNLLTWRQNFNTVHEFYNQRRREIETVQPNAAHMMVADWQKRYGATNITQNIDDLFERAGCGSVLHVHGVLSEMRCMACGSNWSVGYRQWESVVDACPKCASKRGVKPNVVFFNETAPAYGPMYDHFDALKEDDMLVVIGTSGEVVPVGDVAALTPAKTVLSNLESSISVSMPMAPCIEDRQFDIVLHGRASEMAPALDDVVRNHMGF